MRNPIDAFVLARLEREGLKPSPEADRADAAAPRVARSDRPAADARPRSTRSSRDKSPNAYEKVVDRLLASPRYGERMAFRWLDAARYADTQRLSERRRAAHVALARLGDRRVQPQHAVRPVHRRAARRRPAARTPTLDQRIATGFNRNHRGNSEGGIIPEEYAVEYVVDRVDTTATVFLGLTVRLRALPQPQVRPDHAEGVTTSSSPTSTTCRRTARRVGIGNSPPFIKAPTRRAAAEAAAARRRSWPPRRRSSRKLEPRAGAARRREWEQSLAAPARSHWGPSRGLVAHYPLDGDLAAPVAVTRDGKPVPLDAQNGAGGASPTGRVGQAATFDGKGFIQGGDIVGFEQLRLLRRQVHRSPRGSIRRRRPARIVTKRRRRGRAERPRPAT